jgi:type II secretory pathway component PulC
LIGCGVLGWVILQELNAGPQPRSEQPQTQARAPATTPAPYIPQYEMPPAQRFTEIIERPIFSPSRRPAPDAPVSIETVASQLELTLIGVIISDDQQIAIVSPKNGTDFVRLGAGDSYRGWTVAAIEADRVTFRRDDVEEKVQLTYERPPQPKPSARKKRKERKKQIQTQ